MHADLCNSVHNNGGSTHDACSVLERELLYSHHAQFGIEKICSALINDTHSKFSLIVQFLNGLSVYGSEEVWQEGKEKSISGKSSHPVMPHMLWEEERRKQLNTQGVTHRIVNTLSILRDLGDPYTSEYPAPQCLADVEAWWFLSACSY